MAAVRPLMESVSSGTRSGRNAAIEALGEIGDDRAVTVLAPIVEELRSELAVTALRALEKLGWKPTTPEERVHCALIRKAWDEAAAVGPAALEPLLQMTGGKATSELPSIVRALASLTGPEAVKALSGLVAHSDFRVRQVAMKALAARRLRSLLPAREPAGEAGRSPRHGE